MVMLTRWAIVEARSRGITGVFAALFAFIAVFAVALLVLPSTPAAQFSIALSYLAIEAVAAVLLAVRVLLVNRERLAWGFMCLGIVSLVAGDTVETVVAGFGSETGQPNAALSQLLYSGFFLGFFIGLGLVVRARVANPTIDVWLDGLIAGLGLLAVVSLVVLAPGGTVETGQFLSIVYPAAPLVFVAILMGALTGLDRRPSPAWWLQVAAALLMATSNLVFIRAMATQSYTYGSVLDVLWPLATVLVAAAAWSSPTPPPPGDSSFKGMIFVPAAFSFAALIVLWVNERGPGVLWTKRFAVAAIVVGIIRLLTAVSEAEKLRQREKQLNLSLRSARDAALQAAHSKSAFLATMSHEIRTPLNAVLGMNELLLDTDLDDVQREYVENASLSGSLLLELITDILDFSKIEAGAIDLEERQFDLRRLVDTSVTVLSFAAQSKGLPIVAEFSPDCPKTVIGDPTRVRQILVNLIGNAVKFTDGGEVRVSVSLGTTDDRVRFEVADTGKGIDAEHLVSLFDPFTQADNSTTRIHGGSGLGLSICQSLVGMMGGHIEVESTPDVGSRFWFEIDLDDISIPPEFATLELGFGPWGAGSRRSQSRSLRVLVAEDNATLQLLSTRLVTKLGHVVTVVPNGAAAVDAVASERFDVVLMDVHMP
ncbi:MAG: ATP-binding protein, partial [Rhodococcus sp. (in: high G+C Gram-positive bacteria)]